MSTALGLITRMHTPAGLAVALLVIFALFLPGSALAAFPGANGKIAFSSNRDGDFEIYTMNGDGSGVTQLTSNSAADREPRWSPRGDKLVFSSDRDGDFEIYSMSAAGTGVQQLTNNVVDTTPMDDRYPAWSPDGSQIAYATNRDELVPFPYHLHVMDANGSNDSAIFPAYCDETHHPAWSPGGQGVLAYIFQTTNNEDECFDDIPPSVRVTGAGGGTRGFGDGPPEWSPDAGKLAFDDDAPPSPSHDIFVVTDPNDPVNFTTSNLTNSPEDERWPAWSPNGKRIAFVSTDGDEEIYRMNADAGGRLKLTDNSAQDLEPDWQPLNALNPYPRPGGGTPLRVPLVPSYAECTNPNSSHVAPLALPSCTPPTESSSVLTTSTTGKGQGFGQLRVQPGDPSTGTDEADVAITARASDVVCRATSSACPDGAGSDFGGRTLLTSTIRLTDRASGFGGVSATVEDTDFDVPLDCTATPDPARGSVCSAATSADALIPNYVRETKRTVISTFSFTLADPGPNGSGYASPACPPTCGDGDEAPYLVQGVFTGL